MIASFAGNADELWLLVVGYGVLGGFGLGLAYIVPIAMLQKWFPDRRGLLTGLAVGGFGFGAVITSPVAQKLIDDNPEEPTRAFLPLGIAYLVLSLIGAAFFRNPPEGYAVPGYEPATTGRVVDSGRDYCPGEALHTLQWYLLAAILTLNVTAGISLISQAKASATDFAGYSATAAAHAGNAILFFILAAVIYLCYGGGFATMPATAGDYFGLKNAGAIYGLMIIGWSLGGVVGPVIAAALIGEDENYGVAYTTLGVIALAAVLLPLITKPPRTRQRAHEGAVSEKSVA